MCAINFCAKRIIRAVRMPSFATCYSARGMFFPRLAHGRQRRANVVIDSDSSPSVSNPIDTYAGIGLQSVSAASNQIRAPAQHGRTRGELGQSLSNWKSN